MKFSNRFKELRTEKGLTQEDLSKKLELAKSTISMYENGNREPDFEVLEKIADFFNVDINYLLGTSNIRNAHAIIGDNFETIELGKSINIPVVGTIPAGVPIEAIQNVIEYIDIPEEWTKGDKQFIGLKVSGDSMYPLFLDGDTVVIQLQKDAENGDICACYVNGYDATLKRIKLTNGSITLQPENPNYPPKTYIHPGKVTIAGKVVEVRRRF